MPQPAAQPTISFATRVPLDVDARRRLLQQKIGCTVSELIDRALTELERSFCTGHLQPMEKRPDGEQRGANV
jgi:hypothetical protein